MKPFCNPFIGITQASILNKQHNDMVSNNWVLVRARIYNEDGTRFKRIKEVVLIDSDDLYEYYYDDSMTEEENLNRRYIDEHILSMAKGIACEDFYARVKDYDNCQEAYDYARETIERYNECGRW